MTNRRGWGRRGRGHLAAWVLMAVALPTVGASQAAAQATIPAGWVVKVEVPEAVGGKTVIGQLTVDRATQPGYVTAYGCDDGLPMDALGTVVRSDLNYNGRVSPFASNRLIVQADATGELCFYTSTPVDIIVDVNAVSFDVGINSFANRRTDTRTGTFVPQIPAGGNLRVHVPEAVGAKTVIGQLTVDMAARPGYVTAYGCDDGLPRGADGDASKSDLNYNGLVTPFASNRLIVQADADGDVCFYALTAVDMIVDLNAVTDNGIASFPNRRTDTRVPRGGPQVAAGGHVRVHVPEAVGAKTVIGQLTVDRASEPGFVTAFACDDGIPIGNDGQISKSDLNYNGLVTAFASNRLIVQADADGDVCFHTSRPVDVIVDINAVSSNTAINSFANRRTDTRTGTTPVIPGNGAIPTWPEYQPRPALNGIAALTGEPADATVTARPIIAVKIDNYRVARPHWGLDQADAVFELNVEGVSRFVALFHSRLPGEIGPVRSARTADLDLLTAMNRPVFAYSGANQGVTDWIRSASLSGIAVDFNSLYRPCYRRTSERPGPHNLLFDPACSLGIATSAGPAQALWQIDGSWTPPSGTTSQPDTTFRVAMDGVLVDWSWDPSTGRYLRFQDGQPHTAVSGAQIAARTVVEVSSRYIPSVVDARSPHAVSVGTGNAVVHRDGLAIPVTWSRPTAYDPYTFTTAGGAAVPLDQGTTFIELTRSP